MTGRSVDQFAASSSRLSPRHVEVLALVSAGLTNEQVGRRLGIRDDTVKNHLRKIFLRLGVPDRASAVAEAYERGVFLPASGAGVGRDAA